MPERLERPSRLQKARQDSRGFKAARRELCTLVVGGVLGALLLAVLFDGVAVLQFIIGVICAAVAAAILVPAAEFAWNYLQAPHRIMLDELTGIRSTIAALQSPTASQSQADQRLDRHPALLNYIRKGERMRRRFMQSGQGYPNQVEAWTDEVAGFLSSHISPTAADRFIVASLPTAHMSTQIRNSLAMLAEIEEELNRGDYAL
jgi:hypothetical protein